MGRSACHRGASSRRPVFMLHAGLDLSRRKIDVCLLSAGGRDRRGVRVAAGCRRPARPGAPGGELRAGGAWGDRVDERRAVRARPARGARLGGADRRRGQGQGAGAAGVQDRQDRRAGAGGAVGARPGAGDLAARPARSAASASWRAFGCTWSSHRTTLKNRIHATLITFGHPCPVTRSVRRRRPRARPPRGAGSTTPGRTRSAHTGRSNEGTPCCERN